MASGKEIKRRIKSVKNTKKITKAMELVAASKMKKAVSKTLDSRVYASYSWEILRSLLSKETNPNQEIIESADSKNRELIVLITSNRGLCGGYNAQVIRNVIRRIKEDSNIKTDFVTIGRKGDGALRRTGQSVVASFETGETVLLSEVMPIVDFLVLKFNEGVYDRILVQYTDYISALSQKPNLKQLLPFDISLDADNETKKETPDFTFEPSFNEIVPVLKDKIMRVWVYQMLLESLASEQSARMMAMRNASDAAGEMIDDLTVRFNKARQASITKEISEISAGMASVS